MNIRIRTKDQLAMHLQLHHCLWVGDVRGDLTELRAAQKYAHDSSRPAEIHHHHGGEA